jgi:hypothetical protein
MAHGVAWGLFDKDGIADESWDSKVRVNSLMLYFS